MDTRILPLIRAKGLGEWYGQVTYRIDQLIEEAAQRLIQAGEADIAKFVSNPEAFDLRMNPRDYEQHCALQLEKAGWSTRLTAVTGDRGADVIAHRSGKILVVQCKLYSQPVANDAVQQVHAARDFQSADIAAVVSNQPFTKSARQLANVNGIHLLHHGQLCQFTGQRAWLCHRSGASEAPSGYSIKCPSGCNGVLNESMDGDQTIQTHIVFCPGQPDQSFPM